MAEGIADAGDVVVRQEDEHVAQVMVDEIVRQRVIHGRNVRSPAAATALGRALPLLLPARNRRGQRAGHGRLQREVHDGRQVGVESVGIGVVFLPVGDEVRIGLPHFTHDIEVRIFVGNGLGPL